MNPEENAALPAEDNTPAAAPPEPAPVELPKCRPPVNVAERIATGLWAWVLPLMFLLSLVVLIIYTTPYLLYHWRLMSAQAEAEAGFLKRQYELKAEAEFADERIQLVDRRVNLMSLGFQDLVSKLAPVVVNVANYRDATEKDLADPVMRRLSVVYDPDNDRKYVQTGVGSGLIYKPGVILTNHHVIRGAARLRVSFPSGRSIGIDPKAVVSDAKTDLAVVRLPDELPAAMKEEANQSAEFADSTKDVRVGSWVLAMGSPLGLRHTVTHGIISAKGRLMASRDNEDDLIELLQTDAAINPGNSGGPLFDQLGRVVGINAMIASDNDRNQGIGFAIPSNTAKKIADLLLTTGEVPRGFLGIRMEELPGPQAKALKIDDGAVVVRGVEPNTAAAKAGIKPGDVIVRVNQETLERFKPYRHLRQIVADLDPGTEITIDLIRGEERMQVTLVLGKRPANVR
jgi:S1-C subfamily serine protease